MAHTMTSYSVEISAASSFAAGHGVRRRVAVVQSTNPVCRRERLPGCSLSPPPASRGRRPFGDT
jgi:hypothetical protein